jgi:hypothetical protein
VGGVIHDHCSISYLNRDLHQSQRKGQMGHIKEDTCKISGWDKHGWLWEQISEIVKTLQSLRILLEMKYIPSYCQGKLHQIHVPLIYTLNYFLNHFACLYNLPTNKTFFFFFPCQIKELDGSKIIHSCVIFIVFPWLEMKGNITNTQFTLAFTLIQCRPRFGQK